MGIKQLLTRRASAYAVIDDAGPYTLARALGTVLHEEIGIYDNPWTLAHQMVVPEEDEDFEDAAREFFDDVGVDEDAQYVLEIINKGEYYSCMNQAELTDVVIDLAGDQLLTLIAKLQAMSKHTATAAWTTVDLDVVLSPDRDAAEAADELVKLIDVDDVLFTVFMAMYGNPVVDDILALFDIKVTGEYAVVAKAPYVDMAGNEIKHADNEFEPWLAASRLDGTDVRRVWETPDWWEQIKHYARRVTRDNAVRALTLALQAADDSERAEMVYEFEAVLANGHAAVASQRTRSASCLGSVSLHDLIANAQLDDVEYALRIALDKSIYIYEGIDQVLHNMVVTKSGKFWSQDPPKDEWEEAAANYIAAYNLDVNAKYYIDMVEDDVYYHCADMDELVDTVYTLAGDKLLEFIAELKRW